MVKGRLLVALLLVYVFWGSTYLAIAWAIEGIPPFFMASSRFLVAGGILYGFMRLVKGERVERGAWGPAAVMATLLLLMGNGGVVLSEKYVASGVTALLVGFGPFWFVLLGWLWLKGPRPGVTAVAGLLMGFVGLVILVGPGQLTGSAGHTPLLPALLVVGAALSWSVGSIYSKTLKAPASPLMMSGMQMLIASVLMAGAGLALGEHRGFDVGAVTLRSWLAWAYLIVFGSLVGFSAYIYVLRHATPAVASTYAYVNPMVAMFFGWALGGEGLPVQTLVAAGFIIGAVVLISWPQRKGPGPEAERTSTVVDGLADEEVEPEHG